jgi:hypothetical protein
MSAHRENHFRDEARDAQEMNGGSVGISFGIFLGSMRIVIQSRHNVRIPILKKYNSLAVAIGQAVM